MFAAAAFKSLNSSESSGGGYASRDAEGKPFPLYKQPAYYFTDYTPSSLRESAYNLQRNVPTNAVMANNAMQKDGVAQATQQNIAMVNRTQSLATNTYPIGCTSPNDDTQCNLEYPGTKCVAVNMDWNISKGNQTNFCSHVNYPELAGGKYHRLSAAQGGIGKACRRNDECGEGYVCNNKVTMFGKNRQATGYCAQTYSCPDGSVQVAGYPYNSGQPIPPPPDQNNNGRGYRTASECKENVRGYQDCVRGPNGNWFAVFAEYCPVNASLRQGGNPQGAFRTSPPQQNEIVMPGWGLQSSSGISGAPQAFAAWNLNAKADKSNEDVSPLRYEMAINPAPKNYI